MNVRHTRCDQTNLWNWKINNTFVLTLSSWNSGVTLLISDPNVSSEEHFTVAQLLITITLLKHHLTIREMWCQFSGVHVGQSRDFYFFLQLANCWPAASEKHNINLPWPKRGFDKFATFFIFTLRIAAFFWRGKTTRRRSKITVYHCLPWWYVFISLTISLGLQ